MTPSHASWEAEDAERFIRELFEHVLRIRPAPEKEVAAWTRRALASGDAKKVFRALIELPSHKSGLAADIDTKTRWPHGHFYSPVVSRKETIASADRIYGQKPLLGVDLNTTGQLELLARLTPFFATIPFTDEKTSPYRYYYMNPSYGYGDALIYWAMLNLVRPQRIFEIGSGFSSALALDAIDSIGLPTVCTFIDPFPEVVEKATAPLHLPHKIFPQRIQDIDADALRLLEKDDILFIDSSHVLKTGSDVHFELTQLLPRLRPGVLIHFHDVFSGFEYPKTWVLEKNHSWNELYALHLFLMHNVNFRIEFFSDYLAKSHFSEIETQLKALAPRFLRNPGGGLWLRRI